MCISCTSPKIGHFSEEPCLLLLGNSIRNQDLGAKYSLCYWTHCILLLITYGRPRRGLGSVVTCGLVKYAETQVLALSLEVGPGITFNVSSQGFGFAPRLTFQKDRKSTVRMPPGENLYLFSYRCQPGPMLPLVLFLPCEHIGTNVLLLSGPLSSAGTAIDFYLPSDQESLPHQISVGFL